MDLGNENVFQSVTFFLAQCHGLTKLAKLIQKQVMYNCAIAEMIYFTFQNTQFWVIFLLHNKTRYDKINCFHYVCCLHRLLSIIFHIFISSLGISTMETNNTNIMLFVYKLNLEGQKPTIEYQSKKVVTVLPVSFTYNESYLCQITLHHPGDLFYQYILADQSE